MTDFYNIGSIENTGVRYGVLMCKITPGNSRPM